MPISLISTLKLVAVETSIKYLPQGENFMKIGPVDHEIILLKGLFLKKKEINASRTYSLRAGMPRGLNN